MRSTPMQSSAGPWRLALLAVAALLVAFAAARTWSVALRHVGVDFYHFWAVPAAIDAGIASVYDADGRRRLDELMAERAAVMAEPRLRAAKDYWTQAEPTGTPLFYASFAGLAGTGYETGYRAFQAVSSVLAALAVLLLGRFLRVPLEVLLLGAGAVGAAFSPWRHDVMAANVNRLMLVSVVAYAALRFAAGHRRHAGWSIASGGVLALGILFKPILAAAAVTIGVNRLVCRQGRDFALEAGGALAAVAAVLASTLVVYGTATVWVDWLANLRPMLTAHLADLSLGNLAPSLWLERLIGGGAGVLCGLAVAGLIAVQAVGLRRRAPVAPEAMAKADLAALGLAFASFVWLSQLVWAHYYLLALPWLLLALVEAWRRRSPALAALVVLTVGALEFGTAAVATTAIVPLTLALLVLVAGGDGPRAVATAGAGAALAGETRS